MVNGYLSRIITYWNGKLADFRNKYLLIEDGRVVGISNKKPDKIVDYGDYLILPGFVDTHIHLAQIDARARWYPDLIGWLEKYIFPVEAKFKDVQYAQKKAKEFFQELARNGTTTAAVYSSPFKKATEIAFQEAANSGLRIIMGQVFMDMNAPDELLTYVSRAEREVVDLALKWHGFKNMIYYAVTPRFAYSCSMKLMKMLGRVAGEHDLFVQTHISEQLDEIEKVRALYPEYKNYASVYFHANLLGDKTILAHGVHLEDDEIKIIKETDSRISHCPSSNFFLHSGTMDIKKLKDSSLKIGFGSDVGAGAYFSMLEVGRDASYANKISPKEAFYHITLGGAQILNLGNVTGSLEPGKSADFVVLKVPDINASINDILSYLIYLGKAENVVATYTAGRRVYALE